MDDKTFSFEDAYKSSLNYFNGDELAAKVWLDKYCLKDNNGNLLEDTPDKMHWRIANEFARIELKKFKKPLLAQEIFDLLDHFKWIIPQGSPMSAIGNNYQFQSLGNCFVLPPVVDSYGGILYTDQQEIQLMKRRAGVGFDISNIRPKGLVARNAAKTTDGIGIFMERFSNSCREVAQGGRRGALLLSLSIHHPEIETFINIKRKLDKVTGANISIKVTDEFMRAVEQNTEYEQRWPIDSKTPTISKKVSAKYIWDQIIDSSWSVAEPGILYWDTMTKYSLSDQYKFVNPLFADTCTNPCFPASEYLLTENGYEKFGDLFASGKNNNILADNRISYEETADKIEHPNNWKIDLSKSGTIIRPASNVFLTKKGSATLEINTESGFMLKCTPDHHIATSIGMIEAKDLTRNHMILVSVPEKTSSILNREPQTIDEICSFLMGVIAGDGTFGGGSICIDFWGNDRNRMVGLCKNYITILYNREYNTVNERLSNNWDKRKLSSYYITEDTKEKKIRIESTWLKHFLDIKYGFNKNTKLIVPDFILKNARSNIGKYYLCGVGYADGTVNISQRNSQSSIRIGSVDYLFLRQLQLLAHANSILMGIYLRKTACEKIIRNKTVKCQDFYEVITLCGTHKVYAELIGFFGHPQKEEKILKWIDSHEIYSTDFFLKVKNITYKNKEDVFCVRENIGRNIIVNGFSVRRCGEIGMGVDSCRLMLLNLYSYVVDPFSNKSYFDYDLFNKHTEIAQRLMDDMIDLEVDAINRIINKVKSDSEPDRIKQIELDLWNMMLENCKLGRRTGLGITGLGDALAAIDVKYGSRKSIEETENIYKNLAIHSMKSSCLMAQEIGAFPLYNKNIEKDNLFLDRLLSESEELKQLHNKFGRRNISLTTTAPAGSVSCLTQTTSGIEPVYLLKYTRRKKINPSDTSAKIDFVDKMGDKWQEFEVYHHKLNDWMKISGENNIEKSPYFGATSMDVNYLTSIDLQSIAQKWVSHSISKTCNLPKTATKELVSEIYMKAWKSNCKGFTVYRDGSRSGVLIDKKDDKVEKITKTTAPKRPKELNGEIHFFTFRKMRYYVVVGFLHDKEPYEIFSGINNNEDGEIYIPKNLKDGRIVKKGHGSYLFIVNDKEYNLTNGHSDDTADALTRLISCSLRHGVDISFVCDQLGKTEGPMFTFTKVLARTLKKYIKEGAISGEKCPNCGASLVFSEGCRKCPSCSYSGCN